MPSISDTALWLAAVAAGAAGLTYLARVVRNVVRAIAAIQHIVERELEHNHGSSMKDDMTGMAVAIGKLQRDRDADRRRLSRALRMAARHHPEDAWLYLDPDERKHE
jgi:hypothetical protein